MMHTILICGYGPGISQAVARRFGKAGHPVALVARNAQRLTVAVEDLSGEGIQAHAFPADLGDVGTIARVITEVRAVLGPIGILHWNAFFDVDGDLLSVSGSDLNTSFEIRVSSYIAAVKASLADLEAHKGTVLVSSGVMALDETHIDAFATGFAALAIGAAAQHKATGILAHTLAPRGVHVGEVVVNGFVAGTPGAVGRPGGIAPADIAERFWELHMARTAHSIIFGGEVSLPPRTRKVAVADAIASLSVIEGSGGEGDV